MSNFGENNFKIRSNAREAINKLKEIDFLNLYKLDIKKDTTNYTTLHQGTVKSFNQEEFYYVINYDCYIGNLNHFKNKILKIYKDLELFLKYLKKEGNIHIKYYVDKELAINKIESYLLKIKLDKDLENKPKILKRTKI